MRILFDIGHPGHVHFYKHAAWKLMEKGHEVFFSARDKDVTLSLLKQYRFPYRTLSSIGKNKFGLYREFIEREFALLRLVKSFKPDVMTEIGGVFIAPIGKLLGIPTIVFTDTEHASINKVLAYPFASAICTPTSFTDNLGDRQIRYAGSHELAYLSPQYFQPDPQVLKEINVREDEPFIVLRFVAWKASHDIGQQGFTLNVKRQVIKTLEKYGRVFITSEEPLPEEFEPYRITLPPHRIHDLMYYARLLMGDGSTMAEEAGILGTPAIYSSTLAHRMGYLIELMGRYQLVYSYYDPQEALEQAVRILEQPDSKAEWLRRRDRMLSEKIDVTKFLVDTLENYPNYVGGKLKGQVISA